MKYFIVVINEEHSVTRHYTNDEGTLALMKQGLVYRPDNNQIACLIDGDILAWITVKEA